MSAPLTNISENDLFDSIFNRLEEIKRIWKTLKGSLLESLSNFDQFGKALNKNTRVLLGTCNPSDPSSYTVLTLNLLTTEDKMSQRYIHFAQSVSSQLSKSFDEYSEKIESTHTMLADSAAMCMRQITNARQDYAKEKAKYEKVCKETEALVLEKKKLTSDPLLYYNLVQQKRVRARLWNKIKELREAEIQMKEAIDSINDKQPILNSTLSDVLKTFRVALKTALKNMLEAIRRHNKGLGDLVNKNLDDSSSALASSPQAKDQNEAEEKYIEDQYKQRSRSNLDDESKEGERSPFASAKDIGSEDTFAQIQKKLTSNTEKLQDLQVMMYGEEIQKHYEVFCAVVDDRRKIIQGLRAYMQEIATLWENLSKLVQKTSKTPFPNIPNSFAFYKRVGVHLEPFYNALSTLVKKLQNFGTFITMKLSAIDTIITDQKTNFKNYQGNMQKAIKEHLNCRVALETCFQNQEKMQKKIAETSEKDEYDPRLPKMKKELDTLMVQHVELREELRNHAVETAKVITKIEQDFRKVESAKSQSFKLIIEGILGQENCLYQEISSVVKTVNEAIEPDTGIEAEVMLIFGQDEKLAECLRYGDNVKGHKLALAFQKMYVPPAEYATEYEKGQIGALGILYPGEPIDIEDVQDKREDEGAGNAADEEVKENDNDKSSPSKVEHKFQMKSTDKLLGDFSCAMVVQVLPRQGWMYIYENKVCFLSSKLFGDFTMKFPIKEIVKADKKVISLVFDNAMSLTTKYGEIIFTTFFSRDKALSVIESCMKGEQNNDNDPKSPKNGLINLKEVENSNDIQENKDEDNRRDNDVNSNLIEKLNLRPEKDDPKAEPANNEVETAEIIKEKANIMEELKMRKNTIEKSMIGKDNFPVVVIQEIFNCSVSEAFNAVLSDRPVEYKGKKAETVLILTKIEGGDTEIKATKWEPAPPKSILENDTSLEGLRALVKANEKSSRSFSFTHPVDSGMAFLPKSCPVDEKQVVYWLNMDEIVIQAEVRSSKVPLSDCFLVRNSFTLKNIEGNKCEFTWRYGIEFVKSTMFKGKISKTSQEENLDFAKKVALPIIREKMAEYVSTLKRQKPNVSRTLKTGGAVIKENREEEKIERKEREGSNEQRDCSQKIVKDQIDDDLREVLKTYISETKKAQEGMLNEFSGIKFWIMVLTIMNSLILFVLLIK